MAAPKGNKYWQLRSKHGRDKLFESPIALWNAACEYFEWCEENPLKEEKVWQYQGEIVRTKVDKMRAMTLSQLCFYLNCSPGYLRQFKHQNKEKKDKKSQGFLTVIEEIENIIYNQKFQGAAADFLDANIIARDLGLSDKKELTGKEGKDLFTGLTDDEIEAKIAEYERKRNK